MNLKRTNLTPLAIKASVSTLDFQTGSAPSARLRRWKPSVDVALISALVMGRAEEETADDVMTRTRADKESFMSQTTMFEELKLSRKWNQNHDILYVVTIFRFLGFSSMHVL